MFNMMTLRVLLATFFIPQWVSASPALNSSIKTYSFPEGLDLAHAYTIQVQQSTGGLHTVESYNAIVSEANTTSGKGLEHNTSFALFDFEGPVMISVTYNNGPVRSVVIRPYSYNISPTVQGNTISFTLDLPRNVVVQVNDDVFDTLQLFTNAVETDIPSEHDPNVVYFGPGLDNGPSSKNGTLVVPSGKTVYLAPGAVVTSRIAFQNATSGLIQGRGVINPRSSGGVLIEWSSNILVKDILILGAKGFSVTTGTSKNITMLGIRSMSSTGNGDGIDFFCSEDVLIDGVFLRNSDDNIALYQHRWNYYGDSKNITVQNSSLWADWAHPINIGTHGNTDSPETMDGVTIRNIDILDHREPQLWYQGCIAINPGDSNLIQNVHIEDVRVENFRLGQLLNFRVMYNSKYNTSPGRGIRNVFVKDLVYHGSHANPSLFLGYDKDRNISNVTFVNLQINDKVIDDNMAKPSWYYTADFVPMFANEYTGSNRLHNPKLLVQRLPMPRNSSHIHWFYATIFASAPPDVGFGETPINPPALLFSFHAGEKQSPQSCNLMRSKANGRPAQDQRPQQQDQDATKPEDDIPACQSCRKKKARCSREQPCSQCVRFDVACVYDDRRLKPGLRAGAVDQLYRRIDTLENMFLGQSVLWKQVWEALHPNSAFPGAPDEDLNNEETPSRQFVHAREAMKNSMSQLAEAKDKAESSIEAEPNEDNGFRSPKRRKVDVVSTPQQLLRRGTDFDILNLDLVHHLVEFYFANIHHWIPILHVRKFREQIQTYKGRQKAIHILHAIVALCSRFSSDSRLGSDTEKAELAERSRQNVILSSMESFSVENLQALVIIAFDTIGRGRGPSSWSIVGGMARTVEQLQLSVEEEHLSSHSQSGETLIRRMAFLKPSTSWSEAEERRRVFWTVFLMDRFCSVSTGWNISLTSADVKRRLPCEGALWEQETEARPPYFGISDAKAASPHRPLLAESRMTADPKEQDCIGGFAYCIEATESLALVTNFFLHHALDIRDADKAQLWLMRFKELDLRMVQWKFFLPPKWRDASVLNADGIMDPNLTLAHTTHNTAVILLHQGIAYPPLHWKSCPVKLPSTSSAETCLEAASEISTIGQQFLLCSPILTNPQFSFCLFIAGRMLLTHSKYYGTPIPSSLDSLIASLFEISRRWAGPQNVQDNQKDNLASGFAKRLVQARDNFPALSKPSLDIRQTAYSENTDDRALSKHVETVSTPTVLDGSSVLPSHTYVEQEPPLPIPDNHSDTSGFTDIDPFGISLADRDQFNSQPTHVSIWNNATSSLYTDAPIVLNCASPEHPQATLSPGQRISRYGAVEVDRAAAMGEGSAHLGHST
ncbi:hypothetical protein BDV37DRAFT_292156 [Aspergillus pseudonomiae]|uniref:Zn(2)-C6 fungal-type domain-containing protein n=1 Tax=Aspergillus pseudonomiae TaxID=1506151 RepID=A0A5N7CT74_9EURO|nr:uncharacterized protein BDV37DRAFT_292156 [Aspergillus pseudonomiae]KAE8397401.1 hypothetical protein BDV37DRAFT_292156 [Aspergillus pseudonomiae]